jgi:hypothetical protein
MTAFVDILNSWIDQDSPVTQELLDALRGNQYAIAEGVTGAPVVAAGWVPYNKILAGDSNTGLIYSFAVSGAVTTVTSPDFVDGFEYAFLFDRLTVGTQIRANFYRETAAAYAGVMAITPAIGASYSGFLVAERARQSLAGHAFESAMMTDSSASIAPANTQSGRLYIAHGATKNKILRAQFSPTSGGTGTFTAGDIYMFKRRDYRA